VTAPPGVASLIAALSPGRAVTPTQSDEDLLELDIGGLLGNFTASKPGMSTGMRMHSTKVCA